MAPFWDDIDIQFGNGQISYEIHESGYYLEQVSTFLSKRRLSSFQGTWMAVVYYYAVHQYGASNTEVCAN